jgi:thymidylate synthase
MQQYKELLQEILDMGTWKAPSRPNLPKTLSRFGISKRWDLSKGFPLVTTKKMFIRGVFEELFWFLRGSTDLTDLHSRGVKIWDEDGYKYCKAKDGGILSPMTFEDFKKHMDEGYHKEMGYIYSHQWRRFGAWEPWDSGVDQITNLIDGILNDPDGRYKIVTAWNPEQINDCTLPPCHILFQMNCRKMGMFERFKHLREVIDTELGQLWDSTWRNTGKDEKVIMEEMDHFGVPKYKLDCTWFQRSCDSFLGVPFNIASYALLTHIIANITNCSPGDLIFNGGDVHLYEDHIPLAELQLKREPFSLPKLIITRKLTRFDDLKMDDFRLEGYQSHPEIKGKLSTGLF